MVWFVHRARQSRDFRTWRRVDVRTRRRWCSDPANRLVLDGAARFVGNEGEYKGIWNREHRSKDMGTLVGHIAPSIVLVAVGLWHLLSVFSNYVKSPREYVARAWYPANWLPNRGKYIELYLMVVLIPVAIFYELGVSTNFHAIEDGMILKNRVTSFEHSTTLLMFWMYAVIVLLSETTNALPLPTDASFLFASISFGLEWLSVTHESARNQGLESQCNLLLAYIAGLCAVTSGTKLSLDLLWLILRPEWKIQNTIQAFLSDLKLLGFSVSSLVLPSDWPIFRICTCIGQIHWMLSSTRGVTIWFESVHFAEKNSSYWVVEDD